MIISGQYICLDADDMVDCEESQDNPIVIWFNLENISSFSIFNDRRVLRFVNGYEPDILLTSDAANALIHEMRKYRDWVISERIATHKKKKEEAK